ncbi:MAG: hypothetical protein AB9869_06125 [Verrucomicrobiia bacterium]
MKHFLNLRRPLAAACTLGFMVLLPRGFGQDNAFTYQGQLSDSGRPATGSYDFRTILYNAEIGGAQVGPIVTNLNVSVTSGAFNARLDFGSGVFDGTSMR